MQMILFSLEINAVRCSIYHFLHYITILSFEMFELKNFNSSYFTYIANDLYCHWHWRLNRVHYIILLFNKSTMTRKREDLSAFEKLIPKKVDQLTKTSIYLDCNIKRGPVAMACIINKNINLMGMLTFVHTTVDICR